MKKLKRGFTLIEILLVVAILSVLLVVVFAALKPAQRLIDTRNARRWNDVNQILTAVHECIVDNDLTTCGLDALGGTPEQLGTCTGVGAGAVLCDTPAAADDCLDLSTELASYIASIPYDPQVDSDTTPETTGYSVSMTNGIITVNACLSEDSEVISVSR